MSAEDFDDRGNLRYWQPSRPRSHKSMPLINAQDVREWQSRQMLEYASCSIPEGCLTMNIRLSGGYVVALAGQPVFDGDDLDLALQAFNGRS